MARTAWEITEQMYLQDPEIRRLLRHVRLAVKAGRSTTRLSAQIDRFIIELLLFSGVRTSEFCRLRLRDAPLNAGQRSLCVRAGEKEQRDVFLPKHLRRLLRSFVERVRPAFLPDGVACNDGNQPLVLNERRRGYERTAIYRRVCRVLTDAGLGDRASVQLLRHTYGYLAYRLTGGNLLFVQRQLGHAHPMITSVYAKLIDESYDSIADQIEVPVNDTW